MPPARLIQDALWHRLRLRGLQVSFRGALPLPVPKVHKEFNSLGTFSHVWETASSHNCLLGPRVHPPFSPSVSRPILRQWGRRILHSSAQKRPDSSRTNCFAPRVDNITQTYVHLLQQARAGQYQEVEEAAGKLLGEYGEKPNSRIYEALILANTNCSYGSANEVIRLLQDMENEGVEPDSATLHAALQAVAIHPNHLLRTHVLHELRQRWLPLTRNGWHDIVVGLLRERHIEQALDVLEGMQTAEVAPHSWLYDLMIYTLCSAEEFDEALRLLEYCADSDDISISPTLWAHALDCASRALHYPLTRFAFNARVQTSYFNPSEGICTNILSTAARQGDTQLAISVIHILSRRSGNPIQHHHYEALLETYVISKNLRTAFTLLVTMKNAGFSPTEASTRPIYTYLRQSRNSPKKAHKLLYSLRDEGSVIVIQAINVLIESYIHHQNFHAALELYKSMQTLSSDLKPNIATFNALFRGCALYERKDAAMFLASEMVALNVAPDALAYDRLILVCLTSDAGLLENAWSYFKEMRAAGWWPRGGTTMRLAKEACAKADPRVWDLVHDKGGQGGGRGGAGGISREKLDAVLAQYWKGGLEDARARLRVYVDEKRMLSSDRPP